MRGLYTEKIVSGKIPFGQLVSEILSRGDRNRGLNQNLEDPLEDAAAEGTDLRDYTPDMAVACAESISRIANRYWQEDEAEFAQKKQDDRFERY